MKKLIIIIALVLVSVSSSFARTINREVKNVKVTVKTEMTASQKNEFMETLKKELNRRYEVVSTCGTMKTFRVSEDKVIVVAERDGNVYVGEGRTNDDVIDIFEQVYTQINFSK